MLKNFPILSDEKIEEYTRKGYVLIFRHLNAINKERPKEILNKDDFQEAIKAILEFLCTLALPNDISQNRIE